MKSGTIKTPLGLFEYQTVSVNPFEFFTGVIREKVNGKPFLMASPLRALAVIEQRLNEYEITSENQQENALKEIMQEIILSALAEANFFEIGIFHGGTSLRLFYNLQQCFSFEW